MGRLIGGLGDLGRGMAGLEAVKRSGSGVEGGGEDDEGMELFVFISVLPLLFPSVYIRMMLLSPSLGRANGS